MVSYRLNIAILASIFVLIFGSFPLRAQVCSGSLGDPVVNIDFGRGTSEIGPSLNLRDYRYIDPRQERVEDGGYTIKKSTNGLNGGWYNIVNHTPGDYNGYMMVVNADFNPGIFYESQSPINLCPNTTYEFAAWIINILKNEGRKPNITFFILSETDEVLGTYNTGDIPDRDPTWKQYGFLFRTTEADKVKIRMVNNGPGGGGNDIALDDITFRACGPRITTRVNENDAASGDVCYGSTTTVNLTANVEGTPTMKYQWQKYNGFSWDNLINQTNTTLAVPISSTTLIGRYEYRLAVAESGNFNSPSCRTVSPVITINVNPPPQAVALNNGPVCLGDAIVLDLADLAETYEWKDPQGNVIGTTKSVVLQNATYEKAGTYTVTITRGGCIVPASTLVAVIPPPVPVVGNPAPEICEGAEVILSASGGTRYSWSPAEGLSATDIDKPVASPLVTTLYTVRVYAGSCYRTAEVKVIVHKTPRADAGPDKKSLSGSYTRLNGKASGDAIDYFWTPSTDIDDPKSLHPKVSPSISTTYTLNVVSNLGCVTAVDEVFVKVYEKMIVPNVFSPNGDQVNDVWNITAIDAFESPNVKVMNRYGEIVFESTGYLAPWDGRYKNSDLPAGVYYYLIKLRSDEKLLSGSVTLIR